MNADLKHLIRLQTVDASIQEIRERIDRFPGISKALDAKLSSATAHLESVREKIKSNLANRKKLESEVGGNEAKISKYREQMLNVKTNQEYKALQGEIEHAQAGIKNIEDGILTLMMEAETLQGDLKQAEARLKEDQQAVSAERKLLEAENQKDVSAIEGCIKERKEIQSQVSEDLLTRYEVVRKHRGGIGISAARDYLCDVCKVRIRPQVFQEIRKNDRIIECSACQRILYDPENLDHPFEVA
jgi:uncharacterized protein